jgi:hypothetical protein
MKLLRLLYNVQLIVDFPRRFRQWGLLEEFLQSNSWWGLSPGTKNEQLLRISSEQLFNVSPF